MNSQTTTTTTATPNPLSSTCMLVHLRVSLWTGRRQENRIAADAASHHSADRNSITASKYLIPRESLADLTKAAGVLRTNHYRITLPWLDDGPRVLSSDAYWTYQQQFAKDRSEFDSALDSFERAYPSLVRDAHKHLGALHDPSQYPSPSLIRDHFRAAATFLPFPDSRDFRLANMNGELDKLRAELDAIPAAIIETAKRDISDRISGVLTRVVERLGAYTGTREGSFRDSLIGNIGELVEILPMLNVTHDPTIDSLRSKLASLSSIAPEDLRESESLRASTAKEAQSILDTMREFV